MEILDIRQTCQNCRFNDGMIYASNPPKYKCTFENEYYDGLHKCHLNLQPTKSGKWIATPDEHGICATEFQCSVCKECFCTSEMDDDSFIETMKYCPNCGSKMNKESFND